MRLVDAVTYGRYTGDTSTDESIVNAAIDDSTLLLEERLGRQLAYGQYTERLPVYYVAGSQSVFPTVTPLLSVQVNGAAAGDRVRDVDLDADNADGFGAWVSDARNRYATVTYIAGFTPDTLPRSIARDIAACALRDVQTAAPSVIPVGASSIQVGDVAVSFGPEGASSAASGGFGWSAQTLKWRRRRTL